MYCDTLLQVWDSAALTADAVSTNTIDLSGTGSRLGVGAGIVATINVEVAATVAGTEAYRFTIITSASAALTSPTIIVERAYTTAQAATELLAGKFVFLPVPPGSVVQRYIGLNFDGSNTPTITVSAWFMALRGAEVISRPALGFVVS